MTISVQIASNAANLLGVRSVIDKDLTTPPGSPSVLDTYIVAGTGGAWSGFTVDDIAVWNGLTWSKITPDEGWAVWVEDEIAQYFYQDGAWTRFLPWGRVPTDTWANICTEIERGGDVAIDECNVDVDASQDITLTRDTRVRLSPETRLTLNAAIDNGAINVDGDGRKLQWEGGHVDFLDVVNSTQATANVGQFLGLTNVIGGGVFGGTYMAGKLKGTWNASTNVTTDLYGVTGSLASGVGTRGDYWVITTSGTTSIDGFTAWTAEDMAYFNGTIWAEVTDSPSPFLTLGRGDTAIAALDCRDFTIASNSAYGLADVFVYVTGSSSTSGHDDGGPVFITNNSMLGCSSGIGIKRRSKYTFIGHNFFQRCAFPIVASEVSGGEIQPGDRIIISGNIGKDNYRPVELRGRGHAVSVGNLWEDFGYLGTGVIASTPIGFFLSGCRQCTIRDVFKMVDRADSSSPAIAAVVIANLTIGPTTYTAGENRIASDFHDVYRAVQESAGVDANDCTGSSGWGLTSAWSFTNAASKWFGVIDGNHYVVGYPTSNPGAARLYTNSNVLTLGT